MTPKRRSGERSDAFASALEQKVREIASYKPIIGVMGKTGSGKSSLINALFNKSIAKIDNVASCTRKPTEYLLRIQRRLDTTFFDTPGLGESPSMDAKYARLYKELLPKLDLLIWILPANERDYLIDTEFLQKNIPLGRDRSKVIFVLNKVDLLEPMDWNSRSRKCGPKQQVSLKRKIRLVSKEFAVPSRNIIPISTKHGFGLTALVERIIETLPPEKQLGSFLQFEPAVRTEPAQRTAERGLWSTVRAWSRKHWPDIKKTLKEIRDVVMILWPLLVKLAAKRK